MNFWKTFDYSGKEVRVVIHQGKSLKLLDNPNPQTNSDLKLLKADNENSARRLLHLSKLNQQKAVDIFFMLEIKCKPKLEVSPNKNWIEKTWKRIILGFIKMKHKSSWLKKLMEERGTGKSLIWCTMKSLTNRVDFTPYVCASFILASLQVVMDKKHFDYSRKTLSPFSLSFLMLSLFWCSNPFTVIIVFWMLPMELVEAPACWWTHCCQKCVSGLREVLKTRTSWDICLSWT